MKIKLITTTILVCSYYWTRTQFLYIFKCWPDKSDIFRHTHTK